MGSVQLASESREGRNSFSSIRDILESSDLSADAKETLLGIVQAMTLDELTGLPVLSHYRDELRRVRAIMERSNYGNDRPKPVFALAVFDVNGLKEVNDTRGHAAGDGVLQSAATNLLAQLRPGDRLFRVGGDEFIAVIELRTPQVGWSREQLTGSRVLGRIAENYTGPSLSAGVADTRSSYQYGWSVGQMASDADANMYGAKKSQKNHPMGHYFFIKG